MNAWVERVVDGRLARGKHVGLVGGARTPARRSPGGLSFHEALALVGGIVRSGRRIVGFDVVEVAPGPDGDEWDGNVGARLVYEVVGWMLHRGEPVPGRPPSS